MYHKKRDSRWISLAIAAFLLLFAGCSKTADFEFDLEKEFTVAYDSTAYAEVADINAADASSDFSDYKDNIESVEILEAHYFLSYFHGTATQEIITASLQVGAPDGSTSTNLSTLNNINLMSATTESDLPIDASGKDRLAGLIKDSPNTARFYFNGIANEAPLDFRVKFKFKVKVTYKESVL